MSDVVIRVYGDSISMPRYADGIEVGMSWPEILKCAIEQEGKNVFLYNRSLGGAAVSEIFNIVNRDAGYFAGCPGVVIIYCGIVDCAPRPVPQWIRNVIGHMPLLLRKRIISFLHDYRNQVQKVKYWNTTQIRNFRRLYSKMIRRVAENGNCIIAVGIGPVSIGMLARSYGLQQELRRYDGLIAEISGAAENVWYLDLKAKMPMYFKDGRGIAEDEVFLPDGHHFTALGNEIVAKIVFDEIKKLKFT